MIDTTGTTRTISSRFKGPWTTTRKKEKGDSREMTTRKRCLCMGEIATT